VTRLQLAATKPVRLLARAFLLIAEPRWVRAIQSVIYVLMGMGGALMLVAPPESFVQALGVPLVGMFSLFVIVGAMFGFVAVLPGVWWLERAGILSLGTGLIIYGAIVIYLGSSSLASVVTVSLALTLAQRWTLIRGADLAPKKITPACVAV
jgi:hypothetical protein